MRGHLRARVTQHDSVLLSPCTKKKHRHTRLGNPNGGISTGVFSVHSNWSIPKTKIMYVIFSGWSELSNFWTFPNEKILGVVSPHLPGEILRAALVNVSRFLSIFPSSSLSFRQF